MLGRKLLLLFLLSACLSFIDVSARSLREKIRNAPSTTNQFSLIQQDESRPPIFGLNWEDVKPTNNFYPTKREGHSTTVVVTDSPKLYVFGGCYLDISCYNDLYVYDVSSQSWAESSTLQVSGQIPMPRGKHTASLVDGSLWIFGGSSEENYRNDVYQLDVHTLRWTRPVITGNAPSERQGHSAVVVGQKIFVFGGYTLDGYVNDLHVLDTKLLTWSQPCGGLDLEKRADKDFWPTPRSGHTASLFDNKIFVFGGASDMGSTHEIYVFDTATLAWTKPQVSGALPRFREMHAAVVSVALQTIFFLGGCDFSRGQCYNDVWAFNIADRSWTEVSNLEQVPADELHTFTRREGLTASYVEDRIYVFGGCFLAQYCLAPSMLVASPVQLDALGQPAGGVQSGEVLVPVPPPAAPQAPAASLSKSPLISQLAEALAPSQDDAEQDADDNNDVDDDLTQHRFRTAASAQSSAAASAAAASSTQAQASSRMQARTQQVKVEEATYSEQPVSRFDDSLAHTSQSNTAHKKDWQVGGYYVSTLVGLFILGAVAVVATALVVAYSCRKSS